MLKGLVILFSLILISAQAFSRARELKLSTDIYHNSEELFQSHDIALAMSIRYTPVKGLRLQLESALGRKLDFFRGWNPEGEAHITVITPPEFEVLRSKLSMKELDAIADRYDIQLSRMMIMGLGSGKAQIDGKEEETYFLIVDSHELRIIRQMIYYEFTRRGGDRAAFDPTWFFPHITIGYTKRDLHESDGVKKNLKFSLDKRFSLQIGR